MLSKSVLKIHFHRAKTDRSVCHKLASFYTIPLLTRDKAKVTCRRCMRILKLEGGA